ncbi:hypothetical protein ACT4US_34365, partial [Bacillus sp. HC-Mk]
MQSKLITELADLETAFHIRKEVFVKEQGVPLADEFDTFDEIVYALCLQEAHDNKLKYVYIALRFHRMYHIRKEVFVKEQGVPLADEFD